MLRFVLPLAFLTLGALTPTAWAGSLPKGFVYLHDVAPSIIEEMRYAGPHNFVGRPLPGYKAPRCILTRQTAEALAAAQAALRLQNLSIKVYDCYRPTKTVDFFVRWARDANDQKMKAEFYPRTDKADVFRLGYVASRSGHSRGSTVDLTLVPLPVPPQPTYTDGDALVDCTAPVGVRFADNSIDMGTGYDAFDTLAHTDNPKITGQARRNRQLLKSTLQGYGLVNYEKEWWHFTFKPEPWDTYFDFDVE